MKKIHVRTIFNLFFLFIFYILAEFQWEKYCDNQHSFDLYFGILKLSHIYTMTFNVIFQENPMDLEIILDHQHTDGLQLLVNELSESRINNQLSFQVEIIINSETIPGPFHRTFVLKNKSISQENSVRIHVRGKILRQGQGTATLKDGVHMKAIVTKENEDDE